MKTETPQLAADSSARRCSTFPVAVVEWIIGDRRVSALIRNAGLGIQSAGTKQRVKINYKPGEVVTEERVMRAVQSMIDQSNAANTEYKISCPRVIEITESNAEHHARPERT